jgi:hypothetical protein
MINDAYNKVIRDGVTLHESWCADVVRTNDGNTERPANAMPRVQAREHLFTQGKCFNQLACILASCAGAFQRADHNRTLSTQVLSRA